ncbi:Hypothetical_protein [Hexamita inflata]|uniref:Hypothetical_protein n=1 Tax=Hexamita inflata TaxID=28002 RepID=A0AA86NPQ6_9EUKA|nr:Hypothetical protein HINF_LOCUS11019 [Hexamita inflata]
MINIWKSQKIFIADIQIEIVMDNVVFNNQKFNNIELCLWYIFTLKRFLRNASICGVVRIIFVLIVYFFMIKLSNTNSKLKKIKIQQVNDWIHSDFDPDE